ELDDGIHNFVITVTDAAGNVSEESTGFAIDVDTSVPASLSSNDLTILDDVGEIQGPIKNGDVTDDIRPTLEGRAPAGVTEVIIYVGTQEVGRAKVTNNTWTYNLPNNLAAGENTIAVAPVNRVGTPGEKLSVTFTVDTSAPGAVNESSIELYDNVGDVQGLIAKGGTTDDRLPEYRGKVTDANTAFIKVYQDGQFIGKLIPVNVDGTWSYTPPANLSGGMHNFKLAGVSKAGVEGPMSSAWNFNVLASEPSTPTLDTLVDDVGGNTIVQPDGLTNDNTPTITGRGSAGETIIIYLNDTEVTR
ncbi:Ig-like domain-containing protein, partial [Thorsellia kenyensis]